MKKHKLIGKDLPGTLQNIPSPPRELFIIGDSLEELLKSPRIAVVGSRKVTSYGKTVTDQITSELSANGVIIISGLALGVDGIAHRAALNSGGKTIAVLPCGIDEVYPRTHYQLARYILENGGVLISEYPGNTAPQKQNFIARNRLVAGLSNGVLITEAAEKSGTLHTANFALGQGKPVFAVPGNITNPQSKGCNKLIKAGAAPVTEIDDILSVLGIDKNKQTKLINGDDKEEHTILELLKAGITDGHELLKESGQSPSIFNQTLTMLEIKGAIKPIGNNHWTTH